MPNYLNHRATLQCVHGGRVVLIPPLLRSMHVMQSPVLTAEDLQQSFILGCPQIGPGLKPCLKVIQILLGRSIKIQVDGETPLLQTLQALTDGVPPGLVQAINDGGSNATPGLLVPQAATAAMAAANGRGLCEP